MLVRVCGSGVTDFVRERLGRTDIEGRSVLEVGSLDVNGSVRPDIESLKPASYLGVDIARGPRVDEICDVRHLVDRFGNESFDVVVSTELLEHVRDWKGAITNMKRVLRPGGILIVTTRSLGFPLHGYPWDYWLTSPKTSPQSSPISMTSRSSATLRARVSSSRPASHLIDVRRRRLTTFRSTQ